MKRNPPVLQTVIHLLRCQDVELTSSKIQSLKIKHLLQNVVKSQTTEKLWEEARVKVSTCSLQTWDIQSLEIGYIYAPDNWQHFVQNFIGFWKKETFFCRSSNWKKTQSKSVTSSDWWWERMVHMWTGEHTDRHKQTPAGRQRQRRGLIHGQTGLTDSKLIDWLTDRQIDRETDWDRWTDRQRDGQTDGGTDRQTYGQTEKQTDWQKERKKVKQTDTEWLTDQARPNRLIEGQTDHLRDRHPRRQQDQKSGILWHEKSKCTRSASLLRCLWKKPRISVGAEHGSSLTRPLVCCPPSLITHPIAGCQPHGYHPPTQTCHPLSDLSPPPYKCHHSDL